MGKIDAQKSLCSGFSMLWCVSVKAGASVSFLLPWGMSDFSADGREERCKEYEFLNWYCRNNINQSWNNPIESLFEMK